MENYSYYMLFTKDSWVNINILLTTEDTEVTEKRK